MPRGGYWGKILNVDLLKGKIKDEELPDRLYMDFLGGSGLGLRILFSRQRPKIDPLSADNLLGIVCGLLTGTPVPFSGRYSVVAKSPLTGCFGDANSGGFFGPTLKKTGYDAIFIYKKSTKPVYLFLDDNEARINDATELWGMDTYATEDALKSELGKDVQIACIGPAGEKLSLISSIVHDKGRVAARCGLGAVMGSKNLKAIVVRGNREVPVANKKGLEKIRKYWNDYLRSGGALSELQLFSKYGTCAFNEIHAETGNAPCKNWKGSAPIDFKTVDRISGDAIIRYQKHRYACYNCPIGCGGILEIKEGSYAVKDTHKVEYESSAALGIMCLMDNPEALIKANDLCNRLGIDTISAGSTIAFAMECYEEGIITKKHSGGIDLTWGNPDSVVKLLELMGLREGFGEVLADGVKIASQRIGKGAEAFAIHIQGQEPAMMDPRRFPGLILTYKAAITPARHTRGGVWILEEGFSAGGIEYSPFNREVQTGKADAHRKMLSWMEILNAVGTCMFQAFAYKFNAVADFISVVLGLKHTMEDLYRIADRIITLGEAYNVREGLNPAKFNIPHRILGKPPLNKGPSAGTVVDDVTPIREYFELMEWDFNTGKPRREKLHKLGLEDVARQLYSN
jgi:aldehyde:ferredoxin oxidoreductase